MSGHADAGRLGLRDLAAVLDGILDALQQQLREPDWSAWTGELQAAVAAANERDRGLLAAEADPIHPARIYGELLPRLDRDAVVIGDGGDFVSFAGKFVEPARPGGWLDPVPTAASARGSARRSRPGSPGPPSQVVLLLGDGAAGMSAHGRRHPGAARPAGGHGLRQQLRLGAGEGPHADALRVRRDRRPRPADPLRRGRDAPSAAAARR